MGNFSSTTRESSSLEQRPPAQVQGWGQKCNDVKLLLHFGCPTHFSILGKLGSSLCFKSSRRWEQHSPGQNQSLHGDWKEFCTEFPRVQTSSSRLGFNYPVFLSGLSCFGGKFIPPLSTQNIPKATLPVPSCNWDFLSVPFPFPQHLPGRLKNNSEGKELLGPACSEIKSLHKVNFSLRAVSPQASLKFPSSAEGERVRKQKKKKGYKRIKPKRGDSLPKHFISELG